MLFSSLTTSDENVSGTIAAVTSASKDNSWIKEVTVENTQSSMVDSDSYFSLKVASAQVLHEGKQIFDQDGNAVQLLTAVLKDNEGAPLTDAEDNEITEEIYAVYGGKDEDDQDIWYSVDIDDKEIVYSDSKLLTEGYDLDDGLTLSDVAFKFKISDGATEDDNGKLKEVEISYTYADLLGENNSGGISFNDFVSKINGSGLNIRAAYDSVNDKFSFYNSHGGEENTIKFTFDDDSDASLTARNFLNNMGLIKSSGGTLVGSDGKEITKPDSIENGNSVYKDTLLFSLNGSKEIKGDDGSIIVDGMHYKTTDNKITVGGITYNALNKTDEAATVTVSQDVDAIVGKVKSFVEDYNKLLSSLYEKYDEKNDSNYKPLTQSQKDQMKDEQIEKWEEKAKQGLLYHDATLAKIIGDMRSAISSPVEGVEGKYNSAYSIGIGTTGIKGQLTLDETKLRNALSEDSDSVYNVFAKLDANDETDRNGIAQRLGDVFTASTKLIRERAGSSTDITEDSDLNNLLRELQTKMSNFKKMMSSFEDALYKKYDAMESALAKLGMQLNFVTGSFQ